MDKRICQMTDELSKESDRGSMIVAVAWIDDDLTRLLKSYLLSSHRSREKEDELFGVQGYLGTFSAKIDQAYRLALIREQAIVLYISAVVFETILPINLSSSHSSIHVSGTASSKYLG